MKSYKISVLGELIAIDDHDALTRAAAQLIEFADEANPVDQPACVVDEPNEKSQYLVVRDDYRHSDARTICQCTTRETAEAMATKINDQLFADLIAQMTTIELPDDLTPDQISVGPVKDGKYPTTRRCLLCIGDQEINVFWKTNIVSDRWLNTEAIKAAILNREEMSDV